MLSEVRIRHMTNLTRYEEGIGKKDLQIARYYRSDYLGKALIKNFFLTSIGYVLLLGMLMGYNAQYLLANAYKINLVAFGAELLIGYILLLGIYTVVTYSYHAVRYERAKKKVQEYYEELSELERVYNKEAKRTAGNAAGRRD